MDEHRSPAVVLRRAFGLALAAVFAAGGALSAQGHGEKGGHETMKREGPGTHMGARHGGHGALLGHVPAAILHQAELLELSDGQEERVKALKDSLASMRKAHREDRGSMRERLESAFTESGIDVEAYETALRSMADRRISHRVETARIAQRALQVLDEDQREKFLYGVHLMHRMHRMHHGGHAAMGHGQEKHHGEKMMKNRRMESKEEMKEEGGGR